VKSWVQRCGGSITLAAPESVSGAAESVTGAPSQATGSTFVIRLPLAV
jgi:hypothetical protein